MNSNSRFILTSKLPLSMMKASMGAKGKEEVLSKEGILGRFRSNGDSEKQPHRGELPKDVAQGLVEQFSSLRGQDLSGFTCSQERSKQTGAKYDIAVYDAAGELCYEGRKFGGSQGISFWKPGAK
jgi:hypothetical protein